MASLLQLKSYVEQEKLFDIITWLSMLVTLEKTFVLSSLFVNFCFGNC